MGAHWFCRTRKVVFKIKKKFITVRLGNDCNVCPVFPLLKTGSLIKWRFVDPLTAHVPALMDWCSSPQCHRNQVSEYNVSVTDRNDSQKKSHDSIYISQIIHLSERALQSSNMTALILGTSIRINNTAKKNMGENTESVTEERFLFEDRRTGKRSCMYRENSRSLWGHILEIEVKLCFCNRL